MPRHHVGDYGPPTDPDAFEAHYREVHTALARAIPGLIRFSTGHAETVDGSPSPTHLVAERDVESAEAMSAGMRSDAGLAAGADLATFASGGTTMVHVDVRDLTG